MVVAARRNDRLESLADRIERPAARRSPSSVRRHATRTRSRPPSWSARRSDAVRRADQQRGRPAAAATFADLTYEQIERIVEVNVLGVMFGTRAFLPGMLSGRHGHVVNVASLAGRFATPGAAVYAATKHAVVAFSESSNYDGRGPGRARHGGEPRLRDTEGFPQDACTAAWIVMRLERVADAIVRVVRDEIAPELAVPRWLSPLQAFRVLTPPLYRWGVRKGRDMGLKGSKAGEG